MAYEEKPDDNAKTPAEKTLTEIRDFLKQCIENEEDERKKMMDDLLFCTLDQWPDEIRKEREDENQEGGPRPCLTIDKINQYIVQVVNDMRQGRPGINVRSQDDSGDIETAKVLKGMVRNIEDQSKADIAYATAGESAAKIGLGFIRVTTEYVSPDSFDQEIVIKPLPNTFAVYLGPHIMPDGSDSKEGVIVEVMQVDKFKAEYPGKKCKGEEFDSLDALVRGYWRSEDVITVVEYYCLKRVYEELYFLDDGTTMTKEMYDKWPEEAGPKLGIQHKRNSYREQLKWTKATGIEVLEERDLPGRYVPIVEVIGRESWVEGKRVLWGLVRPAKDSLRNFNYWASALTEKMALAPKTPFVGYKGQFTDPKWKYANNKNFPFLEADLLEVNNNIVPLPQRQGAAPMEAAYFHQMQAIEHDVQTALGMFKAATGESESQQSGRAILALQKESDTGTYHFGANLGVSIRHVGRIVVDWIAPFYDTKRVVRIIGDDGEIQTAQLDPDQTESRREIQGVSGGVQSIYNPGVGKWDVSITAGPSYNTKRMEDQATFVEMAKGASDPASAAITRYLVVRNSDNPGAQEAAKLFKSVLPPQALQAMESKEPIPPQVQAMMQQMAAKDAQRQEEFQKLQEENVQLKTGAQVDVMKVRADAQAKKDQLELDRQNDAAEYELKKKKQDDEMKLARAKAIDELELKGLVADGEHDLATKKLQQEKDAATEKQNFEMECRARDDAAKVAEKAEKDAMGVMPQMEKLVEAFIETVKQTAVMHKELVTEIKKPKAVTIGDVSRGADGSIKGAKVNVH